MRQSKHIVALIALGAALMLVLAGAVPGIATWADVTYVSWGQVKNLSGNQSSPTSQSPHGGYLTNTVKCGVCHSVHNSTSTGQALLNTSKSNACTYCHVSPGVSGLKVYDGIMANYTGSDFQNAHNADAGATCAGCHQVHAAESKMTANKYLTTKILMGDKVFDDSDGTPNYDPEVGAPLLNDDQHTALTKWCTQCHYGAGSTAYYYYAGSYNMRSHVMTNSGATFTDYVKASGEQTQVAWNASTQCDSCHTDQFGTGKWPHYTPGARFLIAATQTAGATNSVSAGQTKTDGVCLRCHRGNGKGVGLSF